MQRKAIGKRNARCVKALSKVEQTTYSAQHARATSTSKLTVQEKREKL